MRKKLRPLGAITTDMEPLLLEMIDHHGLQMGEVLNIIRGYIEIHRPDCVEQYVDGTKPVMFYGHRETLHGR